MSSRLTGVIVIDRKEIMPLPPQETQQYTIMSDRRAAVLRQQFQASGIQSTLFVFLILVTAKLINILIMLELWVGIEQQYPFLNANMHGDTLNQHKLPETAVIVPLL